jgi:glycosyltransferase involved in cell wall biosynthesis
MLKVNAYTGGQNVPSARFRVRQLIPYLKQFDVDVTEKISSMGVYPPVSKIARPIWAVGNILENAFKIIQTPKPDVSLLQRELFSTFKTLESFIPSPKILDVDDALFMYRGGSFIGNIAANTEKVICGNDYLADWFGKWNKQIDIIPTAVDAAAYNNIPKQESDKFRILWSGSSSGLPYLYMIEEVLHHFLHNHPDAILNVVSDAAPRFRKLISGKHYEFLKWTPENDINYFKQAEMGIMPMPNDDWTRGKCSYKMLCYMAAGIPVAVSPYGMNKQVLQMGDIGFGCENADDWFDAIQLMYQNQIDRNMKGKTGIGIVQNHFDVKIIAEKLANSLKSVI